jgi:hypothetical protein
MTTGQIRKIVGRLLNPGADWLRFLRAVFCDVGKVFVQLP